MKIAVCYRGYLRSFSQVFDNQNLNLFKNDKNEVDFFCHTWNHYDDQIEFLKSNVNLKRILVEDSKCMDRNPYNTLVPSNKCFEKNFYDRKVIDDLGMHGVPYNCLSQHYSIQKVNCLRKEYAQSKNIFYDCVINMRPDIYFHGDFDITELDLNKINFSWDEKIGNKSIACTDQIAISNEKNIDYYSDSYLYIPGYYFSEKIPIVSEVLLDWHLKSNDISTNVVNSAHSIFRIEHTIKGPNYWFE